MQGECKICLENKDLIKPSATCVHEAIHCKKCLKKHCETEIKDKSNTNVVCPDPLCKKTYEERVVKDLVSPELYDRFMELTFKYFLRNLPDFRWCSNPECGNGQEVDGGELNSFFSCLKCKKKTCFRHKVAWHSDMSCKEYDYVIATNAEQATNDYKAKFTKECPKCKIVIEKGDGCDHMTCREAVGGCNHEFCWLCLAGYAKIRKYGNHHHKSSCQYFAAYTPKEGEESD